MKKFIYGVLAFSAVLFTACSSEEPVTPQEQNPNETAIENEAPKCDGTVTAMVPGQGRASSSFLDENIDRFTATRTDLAYSKYVLVSYHGRNGEQIGMVQLINPENDEVMGEIVFPDSRVNYCNIRNLGGKMTAYIAVDQVSKKEVKHLCGVVCVPMKNNLFDLGEGVTEAQLTPYYVDGVSVNCMKFIEQDNNSAMIVASGGNTALGDDGIAGFTKFKINTTDPTKLETTGHNKLSANLRGYWVSLANTDLMPVAYTYRTVENGDLVWKVAVHKKSRVGDFFNPAKEFGDPDAEAVVMRKKGVTDDRSRFAVSMFNLKDGRFIVVSTGSKVLDSEVGEGGGVRTYRYDESTGTLNLLDVWDKACNNTSNIKDNSYLFAATPSGVFKCKIDYWEDGTMPNNPKVPVRRIQLIPEKKRVTNVMTESDTYASANYVQCNVDMGKVHVAAGYEGYISIPLTGDMWIDADPRTDLVEHPVTE